MPKWIKWLSLSLVVILLDQISKFFIIKFFQLNQSFNVFPFFDLTLAYNYGAAFSWLAQESGWQRLFLIAVAFVVSIFLLVVLIKTAGKNIKQDFAFALILGGAIGNVIDRIRLGYVIDFLDFYIHQYHWPAFNLADSAIVLGIIILFFPQKKGSIANNTAKQV